MAFKKYAYYNKGNQVAIIEQSALSSTGRLAVAHCTIGGYDTKDDCEAAGGQWIPSSGGFSSNIYEKYASPSESVVDGLEIEYTYIPDYHLPITSKLQNNLFYVNGWTVVSGYLTFVRSHEAAITDWTASPYSAVNNNEYIHVSGSERWNGIHKVKSAGDLIQTYTKVNLSVNAVAGSSNVNIAGEGDGKSRISANNSSNIWLNNTFSAGDYIFVASSGTDKNNGFWEVDSIQDSHAQESSSGIYVKNRYYCNITGDIDSEGTDSTPDTSADTNASINIYRAYRDFCKVQADVTALQDESFDLDITRAQANAIVYYIKAKMAEDMLDMEKREYFMRLFKKQLEESLSSRKYGVQMIQGFWGMRK